MLSLEHAMNVSKGIIHSTESFGSVDGPGVRFVVFMQGCNMRCRYCHNPETWSRKGQEVTSDELLKKALRYSSYWGKNLDKGGVTVSGGEPLLQMDFVTDFLRKCKLYGIHTAIDTSGQPFSDDESFISKFDELLKYTDLVLLDLKHFDQEAHKSLTGHTNNNILNMARYLSGKKKPVWIRHVLVKGITDSPEHLSRLKTFISSLDNVEKLEIIPYHTLGVYKWEELGIEYSLKNTPITTKEDIIKAYKIMEST